MLTGKFKLNSAPCNKTLMIISGTNKIKKQTKTMCSQNYRLTPSFTNLIFTTEMVIFFLPIVSWWYMAFSCNTRLARLTMNEVHSVRSVSFSIVYLQTLLEKLKKVVLYTQMHFYFSISCYYAHLWTESPCLTYGRYPALTLYVVFYIWKFPQENSSDIF